MKAYKIPITLKSPLGTPLAADTLFGHLCWGLVYHEGEAALEEFLRQMRSGSPPLILSDPFPAGFLPAPVLPASPAMDDNDKINRKICSMTWQDLVRLGLTEDRPGRTTAKPTEVESHDIAKQMSRQDWISVDLVATIVDQFSSSRIFEARLQIAAKKRPSLKTAQSPHNVINRISSASENLFFKEDTFFEGTEYLYDLYVWSDDYDAGHIKKLLSWAVEGGYGRDKSTGRGVLEIGDPAPAQLPAAKDPNAVMLLGPCMPAQTDPTEGFWQIHAKNPKLGGPWAIGVGPDGEHHNPFKFPMVRLKAGSVLQTTQPKSFYGRMAARVHPDFEQVLQYGLAPALPVQLETAESEVA